MLDPTMADIPDDEVVSDEELLFDDDVQVEWTCSAIVVEGDVLVGKYRVERIPGRNGLGVVVDVKHVDLSHELTLKYLPADACSQPRYVRRFFREARDAVRIDGEHVAKVMDVGRLEFGAPYMVRESLRGPDLSEVVRVRGQLPVSEAVDYVIQTCEAVAEGHALGIVHRNLRPTTLVATRRHDGPSRVKVFDFGAAEALHFDPLTDGGMSLIGTNAILSSVPYMAPEQIRDPYDVDARVDIYALGAILHELLSGAPAIAGQSAPALLAAAVADVPAALRTLREDVPAELESVVLRCLAKDRNSRYASVAELALKLEPFASKDSIVSVHRVLRLVAPPSPVAATPPLSPAALGWCRPPARSQTDTTMLPQRSSLHPLAASWAPPATNTAWRHLATWGSLAGCVALLLFLLTHKAPTTSAQRSAGQGVAVVVPVPAPVVPSVLAAAATPVQVVATAPATAALAPPVVAKSPAVPVPRAPALVARAPHAPAKPGPSAPAKAKASGDMFADPN